MPNFYESSRRHYNDAELLNENERCPNAAHLYGLSAECGVKSLMVAFGIFRRGHSNQLVNVLLEFDESVNSRVSVLYFTQIKKDFKAFGTWNVEDRYESDADNNSKWRQYGDRWKLAAATVQKSLNQAKIDGII